MMDVEEMIKYSCELCMQDKLNLEEKIFMNNILSLKLINPDMNDGKLLIISSIYGNYDMIKLLIHYGCKTDINDNEPLRILAQNNYIKCALLLFNDSIDIDKYDFSASYENLKKIQKIYKKNH